MRRIFTTTEAIADGLTVDALRWGLRAGKWVRGGRGVFLDGPEEPTALELAAASAYVSGGMVSETAAGALLGFDGIAEIEPTFVVATRTNNRRDGVHRSYAQPEDGLIVDGVRVTGGLRTLLDLARVLSDLRWEQALESALRKRVVTESEILAALPEMSRARAHGVRRIRRVMELRPPGAPPTESLLETLFVQLVRAEGLPDPTRQFEVLGPRGRFIARVDLAWPALGVFIELDGQQHLGQPVYDASRQTAVAAATGWLCGRFTWHQVVKTPRASARQVRALLEQGGLDTFAASFAV